MKFGLQSAADEVGVTKTTIWRDVKRGKISAIKNDDGEWEIDAAELFRRYPKETQRNETEQSVMASGSTLAGSETEIALLRDALKQKGDELVTVRETVNDLRKRLDQADSRYDQERTRVAELTTTITALLTHDKKPKTNWVIPVAITVVTLTVIAVIYAIKANIFNLY